MNALILYLYYKSYKEPEAFVTYPHSERELLCRPGEIVVLCFELPTLALKNVPLQTPF